MPVNTGLGKLLVGIGKIPENEKHGNTVGVGKEPVKDGRVDGTEGIGP